MERAEGYSTLDLAVAMWQIAARKGAARRLPWAATFEDRALFTEIRRLATAAGSGGATLFVSMQSRDGFGESYSFGRADGTDVPVTVPDTGFPFEGRAPAGDAMLMVIEGSGRAAKVRVATFRDGLPHGYRRGSPADVEAVEGAAHAAFYASGVAVTDLVLDPVATAAEAIALLRPSDIERHPAPRAAIAAAEASGEAVLLRTDALPGLVLAKPPGHGTYGLLARDEANRAARAWRDAAPILTVAIDLGGERFSAVRRVRGLLQGETCAHPAFCQSIATPGGVAVRTALFDQGRPIGTERPPRDEPFGRQPQR